MPSVETIILLITLFATLTTLVVAITKLMRERPAYA